jgi:hypothetical protein
MLLAYNMKINPKRMKKLEKEYTVMKTKEQEDMVELRVCRLAMFLCEHSADLLPVVTCGFQRDQAY